MSSISQEKQQYEKRKSLFLMVSLDGFFEGPNRDLGWHHVDEELNDYATKQLNEVGKLLFGRVSLTELMASYWPTATAKTDDPIVAEKMNTLPKIVFSTTLKTIDWQNTRLVKENFAEEISELKRVADKDLIIFGSSNLAVTLIKKGLLDEYRIMVNPVVLGEGKRLFEALNSKVNLRLLRTKTFASGNVLLCYEPGSE